jgi:predicted transcriptional regulator of viral defense system
MGGPGRENEPYGRFFIPDAGWDAVGWHAGGHAAGRPAAGRRAAGRRALDGDAALVALGLEQHAVFDLDQLRDLGFSARCVQRRTDKSRLHRIYQAVYSLVPAELLSRDGRFMAAVLASGPGSAISHGSAGVHLDLRPSARAIINITVSSRSPRRHRGIVIHRSITLADQDIALVRNVPCTTVARTLFDLADVVHRRALERAFDRAEQLEQFDLRKINDQIARNAHRAAAPKVRALLAEHYVGSTATDSDFEDRLIPLIYAAGLPLPQTQAYIVLEDGEPALRRDFVWPDQRVNVETDGERFHRTRQAFERDRRNDQRLASAGWRIIRITWNQLEREPDRIIATIARLLGL